MIDDPAMLAALDKWLDESLIPSTFNRREGFFAGWRAAMRHREADTLPLDQVPEGYKIHLLVDYGPYHPADKRWFVELRDPLRDIIVGGSGPNARAAVLAAIGKVGG